MSKDWKCVGADIRLNEIGFYVGETDGRRTAVDLFNINENNQLLKGTQKAVHAINKLCQDVKNICIDRDNVLEQLKTLKVKVKNFKRLTSYYVEDEYDDGVEQRKRKEMMPPSKRVTEVVTSFSQSISKIQVIDSHGTPFGQQFIDEALELIDDDQELAQIHSPRKKSKAVTSMVVHPEEEEDEDVTEPLEEGEIREEGGNQEKDKIKKTSETSKKRKNDSDKSGDNDKPHK